MDKSNVVPFAAVPAVPKPTADVVQEDMLVQAFVRELATLEGYIPPGAHESGLSKERQRIESKAYQMFDQQVRQLLKKHNLIF